MKKRLLPILLALTTLTACSNFSEKPESEWTAQEFFQQAKGAFKSQQWEAAINYYEKLKAYYPYGKYAEQAYLDLAYAYYKYEEPKSAIREVEEFIRIYPKHQALPYAYYLRALAADSINQSWFDQYITDPAKRDIKSTQQAYDYYLALLKRFPNTKYSAESRRRLIALTNRLARHQYLVAKFYYEQRAYLAAANRAKEVIEKYPRAVVNLKALKLLAQAYTKLKMQQNAEDAWRVYHYNVKKLSSQKGEHPNLSEVDPHSTPKNLTPPS